MSATSVTLPSTGAGSSGGESGTVWPLAWALILLVVSAVAVAGRQFAPTAIRARR